MNEMRLGRDVNASASRLWETVTDLDRSPQVLSGVDSVERLDGGGGLRVGTRWRETRTMLGRQATEEMEVTHLSPGRSYTVQADSRGAHYESTVSVEPLNDHRSRLSMTFAAAPNGLIARAFATTIGRLFEGATRKALQKDLDDLAAAAEQSGQ